MSLLKSSIPDTAPAPLVKRVTEATRVPMSLPNPSLSVPEIPGYFLYWHLGKNVPKALKAGYTFVSEEDVEVNQKGVANDPLSSGSTDMGTRVSIAAGGTVSDDDLSPERLYLMKLPNEWRELDLQAQGKINESIAAAIRSGNSDPGVDPDRNKRYMKAGQDLFYPKAPKV